MSVFCALQERLVLPPLERQPRQGPVPVSCTQERLWFIKQLRLVRRAHYEMPIRIRLSGPLDAAALSLAFAQITSRHEILRTRFELIATIPYQFIDPPGRSGLTSIDLSCLMTMYRWKYRG
jgi:Condensation domain